MLHPGNLVQFTENNYKEDLKKGKKLAIIKENKTIFYSLFTKSIEKAGKQTAIYSHSISNGFEY